MLDKSRMEPILGLVPLGPVAPTNARVARNLKLGGWLHQSLIYAGRVKQEVGSSFAERGFGCREWTAPDLAPNDKAGQSTFLSAWTARAEHRGQKNVNDALVQEKKKAYGAYGWDWDLKPSSAATRRVW
jgi:hypothetical protein